MKAIRPANDEEAIGDACGAAPVARAASIGRQQIFDLYGPADAAVLIDLFPVATAVVELSDDGLQFEAVNLPFRMAGLGAHADESPLVEILGPRIVEFLRSPDAKRRFAWEFGTSIDARHFQVMFARRASARRRDRCLVTLIDCTAEQRTENSLRREMTSDSLTGLPNRAGFSDRLDEAIGGDASNHAVLALNLDRFSRVNACMGALAGDELLISVARRLKGALRGHDVLARTGGDEFAMLLQLADGVRDAELVAQRIQAALSTPFRLSDFEIRVDCSIGIALGGSAGDDADDLIRHAQIAMKRSKQTGHVELYRVQAFDAVRTQFSLETSLRRAIDAGEIGFAYQPICDLATGRIVSVEALARWTDEAGVARSPVEFIPVAEESGLIVPLGRWALAEAARTLSEWDAQAGGDCGVSMAVNLSAVQLQRDQIARMVEGVLAERGVAAGRFTLELTESAIGLDPDRTTTAMHALKELGTTLAMDDFGTGYSNLAYLQKLPIDLLKIDRSFVSGMLADRDKVAIVRAILGLAQALGMRTTAEGVETHALEQTLAALGCTYGQGFHYARPVTADAAYRLIAARNA